MDLQELARVLEERREAIGIPRAELARRVGVSTNYVWMVERAKPREDGQPSQPSKDVLERWAEKLGWDEPYTKQLLILAGHTAPELHTNTLPAPRLPFAAG